MTKCPVAVSYRRLAAWKTVPWEIAAPEAHVVLPLGAVVTRHFHGAQRADRRGSVDACRALAFVAVIFVPRGTGEADTGDYIP